MEDTRHLKEPLNRYKAYLSNRLLFAPVGVLVGRCRLDVFSSFLPFSRLSTFIVFVLTVLQRCLDNGFIIRGTVSMLVCDLNYVGTLVYAELVGRHYGDLDLHGGRAAGAGRGHPPSATVCP